jgi:hypothetical protein
MRFKSPPVRIQRSMTTHGITTRIPRGHGQTTVFAATWSGSPQTQNARTVDNVRASMRSPFRGSVDGSNVDRTTCMEGSSNAHTRPPGWTRHVQTRR